MAYPERRFDSRDEVGKNNSAIAQTPTIADNDSHKQTPDSWYLTP
jgi:hypothetical protein